MHLFLASYITLFKEKRRYEYNVFNLDLPLMIAVVVKQKVMGSFRFNDYISQRLDINRLIIFVASSDLGRGWRVHCSAH